VTTALAGGSLATAVGTVEIYRGGATGDRAGESKAALPVPVVYLHSANGESGGLEFLELLADHGEVVAPVFPGFGASEGIASIDDIEDAAFHILDILDRLGLERVDLIGLSLGGWMAAEVAVRWPERVRRLALICAVGLHVDGAPIAEIFGRPLDELADALYADRAHPMAMLMHHMATLESDPSAIPFDLIRPVLEAQAATAKIGWNPYLHNPKLSGRLGRVTGPTLVVHGAADGIVPLAHAEAYAAAIPDARLEVLRDAAHLAVLERPVELAELVLSFLG